MEVSKITEKDNKLLNRKEAKIIVIAEKTPSYSEAKKILADKSKKPEENIIIERVKGKFGRNTFLITAKVYNTIEDLKRVERIKEEAKPAEAEKAENKEEIKEEAKQKEKTE